MVSVIIPLYNKAATVGRAIQSVLRQTVQDFELLVVDDGSTDGSIDAVREQDSDRIRLIEQAHGGVSAARNRGVEMATGDLVAFLDADDEWLPTFLETVLRLEDRFSMCSVFATAYRRHYVDGTEHDIILNGAPAMRSFVISDYFALAASSDPPFCSISVMVRKTVLQAVGGFPEGIHQGEDLLTWARLAIGNKIAYSREPQCIFYTGEMSTMDVPKRIPDTADPVGTGLEQLQRQHPEMETLRQYIACWHKMRASIYLRLRGYEKSCRDEIRKSAHWHSNKKFFLYWILSYIPYRLRMRMLRIGR